MKKILDTPTHSIEIQPGASVSSSSRIITTEDFIERMPGNAWDDIADSGNKRAKAFIARLQSISVVNLDSAYIQGAVSAMVSSSTIRLTQSEADVILG
jgi:hypothetical protein